MSKKMGRSPLGVDFRDFVGVFFGFEESGSSLSFVLMIFWMFRGDLLVFLVLCLEFGSSSTWC